MLHPVNKFGHFWSSVFIYDPICLPKHLLAGGKEVAGYGSVVDLVNYLVHESGLDFTINFTVVPEDVANTAQSYQPFIDANEDMSHVDCVYATGISDIDLCIGAFTKNRHRSGISSFLEMGVSKETFVVAYLFIFMHQNIHSSLLLI